ncbi:MAG TPA: glycoside hydrolase family 5 protein [Acidisarcina sp.]|nr:glycoside hydrolase family 5 protein [Acidisarcina sp.]
MRKFLCLLLFLCSIGAQAQGGFVHREGKNLVDASGKPLLLRGINLGNWLVNEGYMFRLDDGPQSGREIEAYFNELIGPVEAEEFWHEYRQQYITERDIDLIHRAGFNSVRIPLHYKFFLPGNEEGFALLDRVVEWSHKAGLYVILDLHCAPGGQTGTNIDDSWGYPWLYESPEEQQRTIAVWQRIAGHYRNNHTVLGYDMLNEPVPHFPALAKYKPMLEPLEKRIAHAIREVDGNHVIIATGAVWDSDFSVLGAPFDNNILYTFHKYWMPPVQDSIQSYVDFRERYQVPIWLGESGENKDEWVAQFVPLLEKNNIGWAFWPYKKMDQASCPVTFDRPPYWDEVVAYAKLPHGLGNVEKLVAARPSLEHSRAALNGLLHNIRYENTRVNPGYLKALGVEVPAK